MHPLEPVINQTSRSVGGLPFVNLRSCASKQAGYAFLEDENTVGNAFPNGFRFQSFHGFADGLMR